MQLQRLLATLLLLGCSSLEPGLTSDTSHLPFAPGTRLHVHVLDGGQGAVTPDGAYFAWFHDTLLDVDCTFQPATDGVWRCFGGGHVDYSDPACTEPVIVRDVADETSPPRFASATDRFDVLAGSYPMDRVATTYRVDGATHEGTLYQGSGSGCALAGPATFSELVPVPLDTFVAATVSIEGHGAITRTVLHGEDGSRSTFRAYDSTRHWDCDPLWQPNGLTCFPANVAWRSGLYFTDDACSRAAAYGTPSDDPVAVLADDVSPITVYEIGARLPGGSTLRSGPCSALPVERVVWEIGPPIDVATLPMLQPADLGTGRLRARYLGSDDGVAIRPPFDGPIFLDTQRDVECRAEEVNGVLRCVDTRSSDAGLLFADTACTELVVSIASDTPERGLAIVRGPWRTAGRQPIESIHSVHAGALGPMVYQRGADGHCGPNTYVTDTHSFVFVGPRIADDEFAVLHEREI